LEQLSIPDTEISRYAEIARQVRINSIKMVYAASSGHPGGSLSAADILAVLYFREMNIDPVEPDDPDRDRFILSKGHASPGMYSVLSLRGYFPLELLKDFRRLNSKLEGHVHKGVPGIESSTGSLGQGLGVGVGMALAARLDEKDYHVFVMIGDGELEEGNIWESLMAGYKYKLNNLIVILDRNGVQLDGKTQDVMPLHDIPAMVKSFGWNVIEIDGHDIRQIIIALEQAKSSKDLPTFIVAHTVKGKGVSYMEGNYKYHGSPPASEKEYAQALKELGGE
jgi:transketolase